MKLTRLLLFLLAAAAALFFVLRLGHLMRTRTLTIDRTQVVLEKVRRIQKVNLASAFSSRITPDERSNFLARGGHFYFKYVALIRIDVYVDYSRVRYDPALRILHLPPLEFEANVVPGASFLWKTEGDLDDLPSLQRRFTQSEEEIMRNLAVAEARQPDSPLRQKALDSCRQFFAQLDPNLRVEIAP